MLCALLCSGWGNSGRNIPLPWVSLSYSSSLDLKFCKVNIYFISSIKDFGRVYHVKMSKNYKWIHLINMVWNSSECPTGFHCFNEDFCGFSVVNRLFGIKIFFNNFFYKINKICEYQFSRHKSLNDWVPSNWMVTPS